VLTPELEDLAAWSAAPDSVARGLDRLADVDGRVVDDPHVARAAAAVMGASRDLTTKLEADPSLLDVLAHLDQRPTLAPALENPAALTAWRDREHLRIAARDLLGLDDLVVTVAAISALARDVLAGAHALVAPVDPLAVIGMGKLGGDELNYSSDIDIMFVGEGDVAALERSARKIMELVRGSFRVDANLRRRGCA